jgi:hypothetical protein
VRLGLDHRFGGDHSMLLAGPDGQPAQ